MNNCFCTLFDHRYLERGLALYESIDRYCDSFQLWVLCMDDICFEVLEGMHLKQMHLITLTQLEEADIPLKNVKQHRTPVEYYFNCKPSLALYVLKQCEEAVQITYMDADIYFFSSPEQIYDEMAGKSIAVTPHRFRDGLKSLEKHGKFNAGYLLFKRDKNGLACLNWWRTRCIEWCYDIVEDDRYADQKYIDRFSSLFDGVLSIVSIGVNLAPWNIDDKKVTLERDGLYVEEQGIIFYHFHSLRAITTRVYDLGCSKYTPILDETVRRYIYRPYLSALLRNRKGLMTIVEPLKRGGKKEVCNIPKQQVSFVNRCVQRIHLAVMIGKGLKSGKYMFATRSS